MSRRIFTSGRSPFDQPLPPHRRQHIHGAIRPMAETQRVPSTTGLLAAVVAIFCTLYFAAQLLRPYL